MIVVCASGTADRFHGFLRSVMLNLHPGLYVSADLDAGSRQRIWSVLKGWWEADARGTVVMLWRDKNKPSAIDFDVLGCPKRNIVEFEGHWALRGLVEEPCKISVEDRRENNMLPPGLPLHTQG